MGMIILRRGDHMVIEFAINLHRVIKIDVLGHVCVNIWPRRSHRQKNLDLYSQFYLSSKKHRTFFITKETISVLRPDAVAYVITYLITTVKSSKPEYKVLITSCMSCVLNNTDCCYFSKKAIVQKRSSYKLA